MALENVFYSLEQYGVYDVILPFILIFTVVFAVMQKAKIFDDKKINVTIAVVMGLAVIFPHVLGYYPPDRDIVNIINQSLPNVSIVVVAILMAMIIIGVMGKRFELANTSLSGWIALIAFAVVIYIFGSAAKWWGHPNFLRFLDNPDTVALILVILVFAVVIWFITKDDSEHRMTREGFGEKFGKLLQGGKE